MSRKFSFHKQFLLKRYVCACAPGSRSVVTRRKQLRPRLGRRVELPQVVQRRVTQRVASEHEERRAVARHQTVTHSRQARKARRFYTQPNNIPNGNARRRFVLKKTASLCKPVVESEISLGSPRVQHGLGERHSRCHQFGAVLPCVPS